MIDIELHPLVPDTRPAPEAFLEAARESAAALGRSWLYMLALIALSGLVYFAAALRLKAILPQDMPGIIRKRMK